MDNIPKIMSFKKAELKEALNNSLLANTEGDSE